MDTMTMETTKETPKHARELAVIDRRIARVNATLSDVWAPGIPMRMLPPAKRDLYDAALRRYVNLLKAKVRLGGVL